MIPGVQRTSKVIGVGAYSNVEEVIAYRKICAAKIVNEYFKKTVKMPAARSKEQYMRECQLMSTLCHPNIVQFLGMFNSPELSLPALVMERLTMNLHDLLEKGTDTIKQRTSEKQTFPMCLKCSILHDVACGITYLHEQSPLIIHGNLSAKNILLNSAMVAKIGDMSVAHVLSYFSKAVAITPEASVYLPEEAFQEHNTGLDVFSFGVIAIFTLCQKYPCILQKHTYRENEEPIVRTELQRRHEYMEIIYTELDKDHPLIQVIKGAWTTKTIGSTFTLSYIWWRRQKGN